METLAAWGLVSYNRVENGNYIGNNCKLTNNFNVSSFHAIKYFFIHKWANGVFSDYQIVQCFGSNIFQCQLGGRGSDSVAAGKYIDFFLGPVFSTGPL